MSSTRKDMIKILYILPDLAGGGAERLVVDLLLSIDRERFSPALLLFKDEGQGREERRRLGAVGIPIFGLKKKGRVDFHNFWQLYRFLKDLRPDIIHTHLGGDIYGRLAGHFAAPRAIIVSTEHNINREERRIVACLKRFSAHWAAKIVAVSRAVKEDAKKRYHLPEEKFELIYNGIDLRRFQPIAKESGRDFLAVALGRLAPQKGFNSLISAWGKIKLENWRLEIAGVGLEKEALEKQILSAGLSDSVSLVGKQESVAFLGRADLFIMPSMWEGLGLAALEAAAMGKPVIASRIDGLAEIFDETSAWLVPAGDVEALAAMINTVARDINREEVLEKTEKAKKIVRERFSLEQAIASYQALYERLLKAGK